jgi:2-hydroxychromene-2-carboxylate isomerase
MQDRVDEYKVLTRPCAVSPDKGIVPVHGRGLYQDGARRMGSGARCARRGHHARALLPAGEPEAIELKMLKKREVMRVRVFFDTVSPYAYLGVEQLLRHRALWPRGSVEIELVPFFLGGIMASSGNTPPANNPVKARYLQQDVERLGRIHKLPLGSSFPSVFPTNTLQAQRCLAVLHLQRRADELERAALALWRAYWGGGGADIGSAEGLGLTLEAALGRETAAQLVAASTAEATKKHLKVRSHGQNQSFQAIDCPSSWLSWLCVWCLAELDILPLSLLLFFNSFMFHLSLVPGVHGGGGGAGGLWGAVVRGALRCGAAARASVGQRPLRNAVLRAGPAVPRPGRVGQALRKGNSEKRCPK